MSNLFQTIVHPWREQRINNMYESLEQLYPAFARRGDRFPQNWEFPLLKYVFYLCLQGTESGDVALIKQSIAFWESIESNESNSFLFQNKPWLLIDRKFCQTHPSFNTNGQQDFLLLTDQSIHQGFKQLSSDYLEQAWHAIEQTNFISHVYESGSVIVNNQERPTSAAITAYTGKFQGIVYTDWSPDPIGYAESIVHEAAHSLLNYYLEALDVTVSKGTYWSPWRKSDRPTFGVLHGAWAFSHVYLFYQRLAEQTGNADHQARADREKQKLLEASDTLATILEDIDSPSLNSLFANIYPS